MVSFTSLAEEILASAKQLDEHLASKGIDGSSFDNDTLIDLPDDIEDIRNGLIDDTQTLKQLAQGHVAAPMEMVLGVSRQLLQNYTSSITSPINLPL